MSRSMWLNISMAVLLLGFATVAAYADDWPQFGGPDRNGISKETGLLKQWPTGGPKLIWMAEGIGKGYSSAAIAGQTIYVTGNVGADCVMTAFGLDGKEKWHQVFGRAGKGGGMPGSRSTPTVDGDSVYCLAAMGDLSCLDSKTGKPRWSLDFASRFKGHSGGWEYAESVLIDGNNLICTPGGPDACIVALNKNNGETVWTSNGLSDPAGYASCILFKVGKARMIATLTGKGLVAVSAGNGTFLWRWDRPSNTTANCPSPFFYKDSVFCASGYDRGGGLVHVSVTDTGSSINQVWDTRDLVNHHGGYVIINDHIYGHCDKIGWRCLDFATGNVTWTSEGVGKGSVTSADGMLYCLGENHVLGLVVVDPTKFVSAGQFNLPTKGPDPSWAHPSLSNGRLYIRDNETLMCYDVKGK